MNSLAAMYKCNTFKAKKNSQQGAVLVVSLVMLTILTIIALGTMTDTNLQSNMARNSQISLRVFNLSLSELKAQFQASQDNDQMNGKDYLQNLSDVYQTQSTLPIPQADLLMTSVNNPFEQNVDIRFVREGICGGGNEIGATGLIFEMDSYSELNNGTGTGINSDQSFGLCYPNPNDQ
jgi:type II secretory pathway pseudopilin PulG